MSEDYFDGRLDRVEVLIIFGWRDGVLEGILGDSSRNLCWYFRVIAERLETEVLDDRLFGLWALSASESTVLIDEFGDVSDGACVWPVAGGLGSIEARGIVDRLLADRSSTPNLIVRTHDFAEIYGVWDVVPE